MKKPVFGYLRVSGLGQIDGDGFARQREEIERFCAATNREVIRWFEDGGVSGTVDGEDRASYGEMLLLAGPATATEIIVERADRLARMLMVSELCVEEARKRGLTIIEACSGTDLTDSSDPSRVAIRQMMGVFAEWNKSVLVMKLAGARRRMKAGGQRCEGRKPFHQRTPHDAETLSLIMNMRDLQQLTFQAIARKLDKLKRQLPQEGSACWHKSSVQKIYMAEVARRNPVPVRPPAKPSLLAGLVD